MNIVCVVSGSRGHLDFGGWGYIKLAKKLLLRGHKVTWLCDFKNMETLIEHNFVAHHIGDSRKFAVASILRSYRFNERRDLNEDMMRSSIKAAKELETTYKKLKANLILVDRRLPIAIWAADNLNIPAAVIGTPCGYWDQLDSGVVPREKPADAYGGLKERLNQDLGWNIKEISSVWGISKYANICFVGKSFYRKHYAIDETSFYIYRYNKAENQKAWEIKRKKYKTIGISFGNTGNPAKMIELIKVILYLDFGFKSIEVYAGSNSQLHKYLSSLNSTKLNICGWADFNVEFKKLSLIVCFGGIGTIWQAINNEVPCLILSDGIGDQEANARSVIDLKIGHGLSTATPINDQELIEKINDLIKNKKFKNNIKKFKQKSNYTDSLESIVKKLEKIVTDNNN